MSDGVLCNLQGTTADTEAKARRVKPSSLLWCCLCRFFVLDAFGSVPHPKSLIFDFIQKATRGSNIRTISTYATCSSKRTYVREPASLQKTHYDFTTSRQEPSQEHADSRWREYRWMSARIQIGKLQNGERLHLINNIAQHILISPHQTAHSGYASHRITSHHVPQVCNVHRRCGSSRAVFVHVYPRGTQSGRG